MVKIGGCQLNTKSDTVHAQVYIVKLKQFQGNKNVYSCHNNLN